MINNNEKKVLASESLLAASPYPWAKSTQERYAMPPRKRRSLIKNSSQLKSSGFAFLQKRVLRNDEISEHAQNLLKDLLSDHNIDLEDYDDENGSIGEEDDDGDENNEGLGKLRPPISKRFKKSPVSRMPAVDKTMSDETILQASQAGRISFLGSLLRTIQEAEEQAAATSISAVPEEIASSSGTVPVPVTAHHCIKTCCLSVLPAAVPAHMDAKEMVLAALHFLSSDCSFKLATEENDNELLMQQQLIPSLPMIQPVQLAGDLEKRSFRTVGNWKLKNPHTQEQVAALDDIFLHSLCSNSTALPSSASESSLSALKWLGREKFCPRLQMGQDLLLLKGTPPAGITGKKKAAAVNRKKKAAAAGENAQVTATPVTAPSSLTEHQEDPVAAEATRVMNETNKSHLSSLESLVYIN